MVIKNEIGFGEVWSRRTQKLRLPFTIENCKCIEQRKHRVKQTLRRTAGYIDFQQTLRRIAGYIDYNKLCVGLPDTLTTTNSAKEGRIH
jgi:hypothetical protein